MFPGDATDALVRASITVREAFDGYTLVRCPEAPSYWFANCLALDREPAPSAYASWLEKHAAAFAGVPVQRRVVTWEIDARRGLASYDGPIQRERTTIFTTRRAPRRTPTLARIRPFDCARDWAAGLAMQACEWTDSGNAAFVAFEAWRFGHYRRDAAAGACRMWGAWIDDELVAIAGLYANQTWARFINPLTKPQYRRRGLFGAIASLGIAQTLGAWPDATVVIAAESGGETEALYEHLGFHAVGEQHALISPA